MWVCYFHVVSFHLPFRLCVCLRCNPLQYMNGQLMIVSCLIFLPCSFLQVRACDGERVPNFVYDMGIATLKPGFFFFVVVVFVFFFFHATSHCFMFRRVLPPLPLAVLTSPCAFSAHDVDHHEYHAERAEAQACAGITRVYHAFSSRRNDYDAIHVNVILLCVAFRLLYLYISFRLVYLRRSTDPDCCIARSACVSRWNA